MNRQTWALLKRNKNFNVGIYRFAIVALSISLGLSVLWSLLIAYVYLHQPERDYYASNGEMPPIQLKFLSAPNLSSQALLEPDPPTENVERVIPQ